MFTHTHTNTHNLSLAHTHSLTHSLHVYECPAYDTHRVRGRDTLWVKAGHSWGSYDF
jgi:hypothetical protein